MANAACEVFDALKWKNVVGTLSGDDTFLIVARSERDAKTICTELGPLHRAEIKAGENEAMLSSLQIENVAVIQKANVHFENGPECPYRRDRCGQIYPDRLHQCHSGQPHLQGLWCAPGLQKR